MKSLKEQIAELRAAGYKALTAQAKVAHDAVLLAMHRSGFKLKSAIKGGVVMSSITGDIRRATMDMDIDIATDSVYLIYRTFGTGCPTLCASSDKHLQRCIAKHESGEGVRKGGW